MVDELNAWLVAPESTSELFPTQGLRLIRPREPEPADASDKSVAPEGVVRTRSIYGDTSGGWRVKHLSRRRSVRLSVDGPLQMQVTNDAGVAQAGNVIATDLMRLLRVENGDEVEDPSQYLLRVSVLDEPWQFTRVRIRVKRNFRDVDGNDNPDMNPAFVMVSGASDWGSYGLQTLRISHLEFDRFKLPSVVTTALSDPVRYGDGEYADDWFAKPPNATGDLGGLISRIIQAEFSAIGYSGKLSYWNRVEAAAADRWVTGRIGQVIVDSAIFIVDSDESTEVKVLRKEVDERQHLARQRADRLQHLPRNLQRKFVPPSDGLRIVVTWHTQVEGGENSPLGDPVLEVTWRIVFARRP